VLAQYQFDVLVVGGGAAGLTLALKLAEHAKVAIISKKNLTEGSTLYAQGGISAVLDPEDSIQNHINDTVKAGGGLCNEAAVKYAVDRGRELVDWLIDKGVAFTRDTANGDDRYHLTREGGHSQRRVIHAADATGRAVETTLASHVMDHPNITVFEQHIAVDLITGRKLGHTTNACLGAYVLDREHDKVITIAARFTVLATGGASKVYLYTTNPDTSTGDGIAMAWRAQCRVANMEFNQFHPTCLYHPEVKSFLITEAVRGEGGKLLLPDGSRFMDAFHPQAELAPRDVVARAIDHEMKRLGIPCVFLDISHQPASFITTHFPTIYKQCLEHDIDITREPIPVVPAAHYTCGGVVTNLHGETDVPHLYAIGETAFTGMHGANRMASNSLLECMAFAQAASEDVMCKIADTRITESMPAWDESRVTDSDEEVVVSHNWDELRRFMWDYVGIVRTNKRLERARHRTDLLAREIDEYYGNFRVTNDLLELRNLVVVAGLIVDSAMRRKESRGLHYTLDYPNQDNNMPPRDTVLTPPFFQSASAVTPGGV